MEISFDLSSIENISITKDNVKPEGDQSPDKNNARNANPIVHQSIPLEELCIPTGCRLDQL